jgi:hypothetical protein
MKVEEIDGKKIIYMEDEERLTIKRLNKPEDKTIDLYCLNDKIYLRASRSLIGRYDFIHDYVSKKEDIMKSCDTWLEPVNELQDVFKNISDASDEENRKYIMQLEFYDFQSHTEGHEGRRLVMYYKYGNGKEADYYTDYYEGPELKIDYKNEDVFKYLFARVLVNFFENNFKDFKVKINKLPCSIWSLIKEVEGNSVEEIVIWPVDEKVEDYEEIVKSIVNLHNDGLGYDKLIEELESKIHDQIIEMNSLQESIHTTNQNCNRFYDRYRDEIKKTR